MCSIVLISKSSTLVSGSLIHFIQPIFCIYFAWPNGLLMPQTILVENINIAQWEGGGDTFEMRVWSFPLFFLLTSLIGHWKFIQIQYYYFLNNRDGQLVFLIVKAIAWRYGITVSFTLLYFYNLFDYFINKKQLAWHTDYLAPVWTFRRINAGNDSLSTLHKLNVWIDLWCIFTNKQFKMTNWVGLRVARHLLLV